MRQFHPSEEVTPTQLATTTEDIIVNSDVPFNKSNKKSSDLSTEVLPSLNDKARLSDDNQFVGFILGKINLFNCNGQAYCSYITDDGREITHPVGSNALKSFIGLQYFHLHRKGLNKQKYESIEAMLCAYALYDRPEVPVFTTRVAKCVDGSIEIFLGHHNLVAKIDADGYKIQDASVKFLSNKNTGRLPVPSPGRGMKCLFEYINVKQFDDRRAIVGYLCTALLPDGPYPLLSFSGREGSGKSSAAEIIKNILDPSGQVCPAFPKNDSERNIFIRAGKEHILHYDNISTISEALSDTLCLISTGGSIASRALYTDDDQVVKKACNPLILTAITDVLERPDLKSRSLSIHLDKIVQRKERTKMMSDFEVDHPSILHDVFMAMSSALANSDIEVKTDCRMIDFVKRAEAAGTYFGWDMGSFATIMETKEANAKLDSILNDAVGLAIIKYMAHSRKDEVAMRSPVWFSTLASSDFNEFETEFPRKLRTFTQSMDRVAASLEPLGLKVAREKTSSERLVVITKLSEFSNTVERFKSRDENYI